jgi:putative iron-only hydrogenase system regulator
MEKVERLATILITFKKENEQIPILNGILSEHSQYILSRLGLALPHKDYNIITLIVEASIDTINSLAGRLGKLDSLNINVLVEKAKVK